VLSFHKAAEVAEARGCEVVFTGGSERVRAQLARGGVVPSDTVRFEPDLDRGLQRCEDVLLAERSDAMVPTDTGQGSADALAGMPARLRPYLERLELAEGDRLIRQGQPPDDVFVLGSGRLRIEMVTPAGTRIRIRSIHAGVIVGEIALYTGAARSADVVAETPAVVLKLSREAIDAIGTGDPELAWAMHRWFASILAERLTDTTRALEALGG
jgi:sulfate permease, SulP family